MTARDLRAGERWTRAQALKNALLYAAARAFLAATGLLPRAALGPLGALVGRVAHALLPGARRVALANVARAFPALSRREQRALVGRAYRTLGRYLGETILLLRGHPSPLRLDEASKRTLDEARREGAGVVFASAHLGPWEHVGATLVAEGVPLTTIARQSYDPRMTRLYDRLRGGHGIAAIYRGSDGAATRIVRTLRRGGVLGVLMDLRSRVASVDAPFLGHAAPTAVGPARIALRTGAPVVVGTAAPEPGGSGALCVTVTRVETRDLAADPAGERVLTARINAELSRRISALPEGWVWMHPRWG